MARRPKLDAALRATLPMLVLLVAGACGGAPTVPAAEAGPRIASWLPAAQVRVTATRAEPGGSIVGAEVDGEALRFRFSHGDTGWNLEGMVVDGDTLDHAATRAAWLQIVKTPRRVTLAQMVNGDRPAAPLEVLVSGLRVASLSAERMELESVGDASVGRLLLRGRHFDNLPVQQGQAVEVQLQGLAQEGEYWVPERNTIANEVLVELEPLDITLLALLKLRLAEQVIPIPYAIPDMAHDHGEGP